MTWGGTTEAVRGIRKTCLADRRPFGHLVRGPRYLRDPVMGEICRSAMTDLARPHPQPLRGTVDLSLCYRSIERRMTGSQRHTLNHSLVGAPPRAAEGLVPFQAGQAY